MSQMSPVDVLVEPHEREALRRPGDQAGNSSISGRSVSWTRSEPSVATLQMSPPVGAFVAGSKTVREKAICPSGGVVAPAAGLDGATVADGLARRRGAARQQASAEHGDEGPPFTSRRPRG